MGLFLKASHGNSFSAAAAAVERTKVMGAEVDVEQLFIPPAHRTRDLFTDDCSSAKRQSIKG